MPPIKGRMMGRMGGPAPISSDLSLHKSLGFARTKSKFTGRGAKNGPVCTVKDDQLKRLRIPSKICRSLPSVKKFSNSRGYIDITEDDGMGESSEPSGEILGLKRGRGASNKYHIQVTAERRFPGMVWDVAFSPNPEESTVLIACGESAFLCDHELNKVHTLENIRLAGGVGFLSDLRIVGMCRFMDKVNIYSPSGEFLHDFPCGSGPMTLAVNASDEILVSDCSTKQIHFYDSKGTLLRDVQPKGLNYKLEWPLYMAVLKNTDFVVVDCHQQVMLIFNQKGNYVRSIPMRTYGGNEVLRPHGICLTPDQDLCIIDNAIDTVEVFSTRGVYYQTLMPSEVGGRLRPKILACSTDGRMVVGSMKGHVRLFKFVDEVDAKLELVAVKEEVDKKVKVNCKPKVKKDKVNVEVKVKSEIKSEVIDDVTVIVLD